MTKDSTSIASGIAGFVMTLALTAFAAGAILLVYISYRFEEHAYASLLGPFGAAWLFGYGSLTVAMGLAAGLNITKVALIYNIARLKVTREGRRAPPILLRLLVLSLSLIMTLLIFAGQTVSPNAEARTAELRAAARESHAGDVADINQRFDARIAQVTTRSAAEIAALRDTSGTRLAELNAKLDVERGIGGAHFRGPKYQELERLIALEVDDTNARINAAQAKERQAIADLEKQRQTRLDATTRDLAATLANDTLSTVFNSAEAQHPYILRAIQIVRSFTPEDWPVSPVQITIFLALLLSFALEMAPIVTLGFVFRNLVRAGLEPDIREPAPVAANQPTAPGHPGHETNDIPSDGIPQGPRPLRTASEQS